MIEGCMEKQLAVILKVTDRTSTESAAPDALFLHPVSLSARESA